jgi:spore coat polysaccharide biosynthesis predicted glycosyltransferase SpsG
MGGSDFLQLTEPIVDGLKDLDIEICVAIGPTNGQRQQIEETVRSITLARVIRQDDYITELASSSLAILAAGSSLWEAAALGVPSIGLIVADNQNVASRAAHRLGIAVSIDFRTEIRINELRGEVESRLEQSNAKSTMKQLRIVGSVDVDGVMHVASTIRTTS